MTGPSADRLLRVWLWISAPLRVWLWVSAPLALGGAAAILIGMNVESLRVVQFGAALFVPFMLGYYPILGFILFGIVCFISDKIAKLLRGDRTQGPRKKKSSAGVTRGRSKGLWDREIDG